MAPAGKGVHIMERPNQRSAGGQTREHAKIQQVRRPMEMKDFRRRKLAFHETAEECPVVSHVCALREAQEMALDIARSTEQELVQGARPPESGFEFHDPRIVAALGSDKHG